MLFRSINTAFSWLFERIKSDTEQLYTSESASSAHSYRVLHEVEKIVITPAAYGYILQLQQLEIIDINEVEQVIERAMMLSVSKVDVNDIKSIVASLFFNLDDGDYNYLGKSILDTDGIIH